MYSQTQSFFHRWKVSSEPRVFTTGPLNDAEGNEAHPGETHRYHVVHLPNPESLGQDIAANRPVTGLLQQIFAVITGAVPPEGESLVTETTPLRHDEVPFLWLLEGSDGLGPVPLIEDLLVNNVAILYRQPACGPVVYHPNPQPNPITGQLERVPVKDPDGNVVRQPVLRTNFGDFMGRGEIQLFISPPVTPGTAFNSGTVDKGGLYLVFKSDCLEPIELEVSARMTIHVTNL